MPPLCRGETGAEGPANPAIAPRKLGNAAVLARVGNAEMGMPGLPPQFLAAYAGDPAAYARYRALPTERLPKHFDGISRRRLGEREHLSSATIERWFLWYLSLLAGERSSAPVHGFLGIDEHS